MERHRRELATRGRTSGEKSTAKYFVSREERMFAELLLREKEDHRFLSDGMSMDTSCDYDIDVQVPSIIPLGKCDRSSGGGLDRRVFLVHG